MTTKAIPLGTDDSALNTESQRTAGGLQEKNGDRYFAILFENALDAIVVLDDVACVVDSNPVRVSIVDNDGWYEQTVLGVWLRSRQPRTFCLIGT
jgi:hypothetical protein